jgi:hypothetical protein
LRFSVHSITQITMLDHTSEDTYVFSERCNEQTLTAALKLKKKNTRNRYLQTILNILVGLNF